MTTVIRKDAVKLKLGHFLDRTEIQRENIRLSPSATSLGHHECRNLASTLPSSPGREERLLEVAQLVLLTQEWSVQ